MNHPAMLTIAIPPMVVARLLAFNRE